MSSGSKRGASTVVGVLLLVGVVVIVGGVVALGALTFLDGTGAPQATATFDYEQTPAGLRMTPNAISTAVIVQLNGRDVTTFTPDSAGQSALLPTAPGDRITVVSTDGERSVLVQRTVEDRSEIGDFIAHYTFESGSGNKLVDRSGNGNHGTLRDYDDGLGPQWNDGSLQFDGKNDYVDVTGLEAEADVEEFTVAVAFKQQSTSPDGTSQLVEHYGGGNEWYLETDNAGNDYTIDYAVNHGGGEVIKTGERYSTGQRQVAVGTFDGSTYEMFVDGEQIESDTYNSDVKMGNLVIGGDAPDGDIQHLDGEIYEIRLYYTAFDGEEVRVITNAIG